MPAHVQLCAQIILGIASVACLCDIGATQPAPRENFEALLKRGFELHQQAKFSEAIPLLRTAHQLQPGDYFANLLLGIDLLRTSKPSEALVFLRTASHSPQADEIAQGYLGEAEADLGQYAAAAEAYQRALIKSPNSDESLLAWAGFALERFRALGEQMRASDAGIATVRRLQQAASQSYSTLACSIPIPVLERRLSENKSSVAENADVLYRLSVCYAIEAGKAADRLMQVSNDSAAIHRLRGDVLLRLKQDALAAEKEFREAIALRPGDPALLERMAEAQLMAGDADGAMESARAALVVDPTRREALHTLATISMSRRDYESALPLLRRLSSQAPGDKSFQIDLARCLAQTGDSAEALKYLKPALAAGYPDEKGALHALEARILRELGREAEAAQASAEARRLSDAFQAKNKANPNGKENEHN